MENGSSGALHCANHPQVETVLRCNRCGKPICSRCAQHTPVGYRCKECIRGQQDVFYTASKGHQALAGIVAVVLGLLLGVAAFFVSELSWLSIFVAPVVGGVVGEAVFRASGRQRARGFDWIGGGLVAVGALLTFAPLYILLRFLDVWTLLWGLLFVALAVATAYARLR